MAKHEIACSINPGCGNAAFAHMERTATPIRMAVGGGGPAGMEAARVATERGHMVTLFEQAGERGPDQEVDDGAVDRVIPPAGARGSGGRRRCLRVKR